MFDVTEVTGEFECCQYHTKQTANLIIEVSEDQARLLARQIQRKLLLASMKPADY
jgi:hypothetical protein